MSVAAFRFFFDDTASVDIYTLSLHDALPIYFYRFGVITSHSIFYHEVMIESRVVGRSEERFSRNAETDLVCRLLLEKKNAALRVHLAPQPPRLLLDVRPRRHPDVRCPQVLPV